MTGGLGMGSRCSMRHSPQMAAFLERHYLGRLESRPYKDLNLKLILYSG